MNTINLLALLLVSILLSAMVAGYSTLSTSHLRHWARQKDDAAKKLYPLKARGSGALLTLEMFRALSLSAVVVIITSNLSSWTSWLLIALLLFVAFIVLTQLFLKPLGVRMLIWFSSSILSITHALKPLTLPLGRVFDRFIDDEPITLTRNELDKMLCEVAPGDTDLNDFEIQILKKVLGFSGLRVHDVMIPRSKMVTVLADEELTPIVINDLYKSGHSHFPVMGDDKKTVVGFLNMHDLMDIKQHGKASDAMQQKVYFVDEDRNLEQVLEVFYKTKQTVFVVHNSASDAVGLITIEDVLQQILGKPSEKVHHETEPSTSDEEVAVVE